MKRDFLISLVSERDTEGKYRYASIGRITFIIVLGLAIWTWTMGTGDIQPSHMQMLLAATTYNLMKKSTWFGSPTTTTKSTDDETPPRI